MKKIILIIFLTCGISNNLLSWDSEAAKYFPLNIGNSWAYTHVDYAFGCAPVNTYNHKITVVTDSIINGHVYFKFSDGSLHRIDSNSMNVYRRNFDTDCLTDSLHARIGDQYVNCSISYVMTDTNIIVFGGQPRRTTGAVVLDADLRRLMYGIGLFSSGTCVHPIGGAVETLKGCVIDGVVYGDTSVTTQNYDFMRYFPLQVGNVWVYDGFGFPCCGSYLLKISLLGSVIFNGHLYFKTVSTLSVDTAFVRVDSSKGLIVYKSTTSGCNWLIGETTGDSLLSKLGDSSFTKCTNRTACIDTLDQEIFGLNRERKIFYDQYFEGYESRKYLMDFGLVNVENQLHTGHDSKLLKGCVINGIVYGDTSFVEFQTVTGTVKYEDNNQNVTSGYVKAYRHSYQGYMDVLDSAVIQPNGTYTLTKIPSHDTTDLMAFQNDEINGHDFVPTYYVSTIYWQEADHIYLNGDTTGIDIRVFRINNDRFGTKSISGGVYGYTESDIYLGISDARLYAVSQSTFRLYDISGYTGLYSIDSLPSGFYQIICNRIGFETQTQDVYIGNTNRTDINFYFDHLVSAPEKNSIPEQFTLFQNYPNPFNPVTHLRFNIGKIGYTSLIIYDVQGQELVRLVNEELKPGQYDIEWDGTNCPSGVYFYQLRSGTFTKSMKMVLIK